MNLNKDWLVGFVDGEGSFYIGINKNLTMKSGIQVLPEFRIVQHFRDVKLLYSIQKFFNCGIVTKNRGKNSSSLIMEYRVRNIKHLANIIIPFFKQNSLLTVKMLDFIDFANVIDIMNKKEHFTEAGLEKIKQLKLKMNRNRLIFLDKDIVRS